MTQTTTTNGPEERVRDLAESVGVDADFAATVFDHIEAGDGYADYGVPAAVYAAVRIEGLAVRPQEVAAETTGVDAGRIMTDTKRMVRRLPFDVDIDPSAKYIERFGEDLGAGSQLATTANAIASHATEAGLSNGRSPSVFAATCLYAASYLLDAGYTQDEVADAAGVSAVVIRRHYKDFVAAYAAEDTESSSVGALVESVIDAYDWLPDAAVDDARDMAVAVDTDSGEFRRASPKSVAAAIVYVAAKHHRVDMSQAEAGDAIGASRHAVNARSQDVQRWNRRRRLDGENYNDLKRLAAEHGVDVGMAPDRDDLIESLAEAGVSP